MGIIQHDAIVIVSGNAAHIEEARDFAVSTGLAVSEMSPVLINGYQSFCVFPDGSKEGWEDSDRGDESRRAILEWLAEYNSFQWAAVSVGELGAYLMETSDTVGRERTAVEMLRVQGYYVEKSDRVLVERDREVERLKEEVAVLRHALSRVSRVMVP